jgi:hypothetical protein
MRPYLVIFLLCGCVTRTDHSLVIPDTITTSRAADERKIPGTDLSMHLPLGFTIDSALQTVFDDSTASIQVVYVPGRPLLDRTATIRGQEEERIHEDRSLLYHIYHFSLNGNDASLYYSKSDHHGKDRVLLFVGNHQFAAAAIGEFPENEPAIRDSVLKALLSIWTNDDLPDDIASMEPFTLDLSNSEFSYSSHTGMAFFYTIGGEANPDFEVTRDQFMVIAPLPRKNEDLRNRVLEVLRLYAKAQMDIHVYSAHKTYVRENEAYELEGNVRAKNQDGKVYILAMAGQLHTIMLAALLYKNVNQRLNEVIYIAHSLQFTHTITH